ncbi:MAG: iron-containing alcohol dehydrogenase [Halanaerobium sp.]|nr:iron-containing alcohol dehydrogenase [Halanaerobium sp.]
MHYAGTIAGMAFANSFLGICHSMAHKLGSTFNLPHGLANALLINPVIHYNATDVPVKQTSFPQYKYPLAKRRYSEIANHLGLPGEGDTEKVHHLTAAIKELARELNIPVSIKELGISRDSFLQELDRMAELAFDDQCTLANPRYPLIEEIKELYLQAYHGEI